MPRKWYPQEGDVKDAAATSRVLRRVYDQLYELNTKLENLPSTIESGGGGPTVTPPKDSLLAVLTDSSFGPSGGDSNVPPVPALVPNVAALPPISTSVDGQVVWLFGAVYRFDIGTVPPGWKLITAQAVVLRGTYAARVGATTVPAGTMYWSTDRTVLHYSDATNWIYMLGTQYNTLANIAVGLAATDAGYLFQATDYHHLYRWTGSAWEWAPGELGSGYLMPFSAAPVPTGAWKLADGTGSPVTIATSTGGTTTVTLGDHRGYYLKFGAAYDTTPNAAAGTSSLPSDTNTGAATAQNITGATNAAPIVITTETSHGLASNDQIAILGVTGNLNANGVWIITVLSATTFELNTSAGSGAYTAGTGVVHEDFASPDHTHTPSTLEPANAVWLPYMRR